MCLCIDMCTWVHICAYVPAKVKRRHQISCSWSYRWLLVAWHGFSVRAVCILNYWAIFLALDLYLDDFMMIFRWVDESSVTGRWSLYLHALFAFIPSRALGMPLESYSTCLMNCQSSLLPKKPRFLNQKMWAPRLAIVYLISLTLGEFLDFSESLPIR